MPARPPIERLLYLHGFRSSPQSLKARTVAAWMRRHRPEVAWHCPQLPPSPRAAMAMLVELSAAWPATSSGVIGSSLGGFYAMALAARTGCRAVLLNPAVDPARDLARHIGELQAWHSDERFFFRPEFIDELHAIGQPVLAGPRRCFAVIAKGDELLDWVEMRERCAGCSIKLLEGSDHALTDFDAHLPEVMAFLGLTA
jgi:predicted esterase YcpF (UPF0227 family)